MLRAPGRLPRPNSSEVRALMKTELVAANVREAGGEQFFTQALALAAERAVTLEAALLEELRLRRWRAKRAAHVLIGGRKVRSRLQRQPGMPSQPSSILPHIERLLLHRRKHRSDLLDVEIRGHAWIPGPLDHRRQLTLLELLQRPGERILDQGPIPRG